MNEKKDYKILRRICTAVARTAMRLYFRLEIEGAENLQKVEGVLVCSNHRSGLDPILVMMGAKQRFIHFFGKQSLSKHKLIRWLLCDVLCMHTVSHSGGDLSAIKWGVGNLRAGKPVGIFPEGTRNRTEEPLLPFEAGTAVIACMAKVPVIPVSISTTYKLWSKCRIVYGAPIFFDDYYAKRPDEAAKEHIMQEIRENVLKNLKK